MHHNVTVFGDGPLKSALDNIKKYKVEDKIELRLGDGLSTYTDDIDTVVVSCPKLIIAPTFLSKLAFLTSK